MTAVRTYAASDFARAFGAAAADVPVIAGAARGFDLRYSRIDAETRDAVLADIAERTVGSARVGDHRRGLWEDCWHDVARQFADTAAGAEALTPPFMARLPVLRLDGDFARPFDAGFENSWQAVLRHWLCRTYLGGATAVYEFGCGSGRNLVDMAALLPGARFTGLDWSPSAAALVSEAGCRLGLALHGGVFDFFAPDPGLRLEIGAVAMTVHALEQVGDRHGAFVDWLLERRPALVIHVEPMMELYDPADPFDRLALGYHRARGYLSGLLPRVRALEAAGKATIVKARRTGFGSTYNEGCSLLIWRPA